MKIYVAGKYQDKDKVRYIHQLLRGSGHEITCDWTNEVKYPNNAPPEDKKYYAIDDVRGVKDADLIIVLMTIPYEYKGAWVEFGIALGTDTPIRVIGDCGDKCIFINHPLVTKYTDIQSAIGDICLEQI
jgi:hypothetical protein